MIPHGFYMKIAFTGKGGSGKSTMATALVRDFRNRNKRVLAIDADHNMDLSYNLGADPRVFLGTDPDRIKEYMGSNREDTYQATLELGRSIGMAFKTFPADRYTAEVSIELEPGLRLMVAGPHTDRVRSQESCSHSLAAPLKVYLPLLHLDRNDEVVIDERAGTDPIATGILSGVDLVVIVREATVNSGRVAEQIRYELSLAGIPYVIIDNKISGIETDTAAMIATIQSYRK